LDALESAEKIELLITPAQFPPGQPHGVALGRIARVKRPGVKMLFISKPEDQQFTEGVGEILLAPVTVDEIVAKIREMLPKSA
jgi:hypothetical protein